MIIAALVFALATLPQETLDAYRDGTGMGMAKPAELNGYPGPRHVLDLGEQLHLTPEQRTKVQSIYDAMHAEAVKLGAEIINLETALDRGFAEKKIDVRGVEEQSAKIAMLQGRLRAVHLEAHLATKAVLDARQVAAYAKLRGYGSATNEHAHHHTN